MALDQHGALLKMGVIVSQHHLTGRLCWSWLSWFICLSTRKWGRPLPCTGAALAEESGGSADSWRMLAIVWAYLLFDSAMADFLSYSFVSSPCAGGAGVVDCVNGYPCGGGFIESGESGNLSRENRNVILCECGSQLLGLRVAALLD